VNSQVFIPASAGQISSAVITIPAGSCCARIEPSLSDVDYAAGKTINGTAAVIVAGQIAQSYEFNLKTGPRGDGNPPFAMLNQETPFAADAVQIVLVCDDPACVLAGVLSFGDIASNLPATLRPAKVRP